MSNHSFKEFISLIEHDQLIRQLHKDIALIKSLQEVNNSDQLQLTKIHEAQETRLTDSRAQLQELENQMKKLEAAEKNNKKLLEETSSGKEYQAIKKEIAYIQQQQHKLEESLLAQWNQYELNQKTSEAQHKDYEQKKEQLVKTSTESQESLVKLQKQEEKLLRERKAKEKDVPMEWLEKYSHMRTQTADPVVPVTGNSCSSCFYFLSDPEVVKLRKMALVQCKGCFRLLYLPEVWNGVKQ